MEIALPTNLVRRNFPVVANRVQKKGRKVDSLPFESALLSVSLQHLGKRS